MKKFIRTLSVLCAVCILISAFAISAYAIPRTRTVRISCMWNGSYMVNDNGEGKYSNDLGASSVWQLVMASPSSYTIESWDGTYLRAVNDKVVCVDTYDGSDMSYRWYLSGSDNGNTRIISALYPNKAINIENLTGALQLTEYYDTWESAQWIIKDIYTPEFSQRTNNVIFQSIDEKNYLFNGVVIGSTGTMQAFINGNYLYEIIDRGSYCYIKYNPAQSNYSEYFTASSSTTYSTSSTLDEGSDNFKWNIVKNTDGTVSIVSVAYPDMCIANYQCCTLINKSSSGDKGKWNMHSGNSLIIRLTDSMHTHTLTLNNSDREKAMFKYSANNVLTGAEAQWQVIYNGNKMYLKNVLTGKYLGTSNVEGDKLVYVKDYNYSYDNLFVWNAVNLRYPLGLNQDNSTYLHPDYNGSYTNDCDASVATPNIYTDNYLDFQVVGFAD